MKKLNWFEILFWIFIIILIIMILTRIFGKSATDTQIYITLIIVMLTIMGSLVKIMSYIVKMNREIGEIKVQMTNNFDSIKKDITLIKNKLKIK